MDDEIGATEIVPFMNSDLKKEKKKEQDMLAELMRKSDGYENPLVGELEALQNEMLEDTSEPMSLLKIARVIFNNPMTWLRKKVNSFGALTSTPRSPG